MDEAQRRNSVMVTERTLLEMQDRLFGTSVDTENAPDEAGRAGSP